MSPPKIKLAETDLAAIVVKHLQDDEGWEIYQEVQIKSYGSIADIVAVKNGEVMVVETKTSFGLNVLGQAWHWKKLATYAVVAIPSATNQTKARHFGRQVAWKFGLGVFTVNPFYGHVTVDVSPQKNTGADTKKILDVLTTQHKTFAPAGSKEGKHLTRFKMTCQELTKVVKQNPGICLKKAITRIKHHYKNDRSASQSLGKQISRFDNVSTIYGEWDGKLKCLRLYARSGFPSPFPPRRKSIEDSAKTEI